MAYVGGVGLDVDWSSGEVDRDGDLETRRYVDPEPGLNATAWLIYRDGTLVELRFGMAP